MHSQLVYIPTLGDGALRLPLWYPCASCRPMLLYETHSQFLEPRNSCNIEDELTSVGSRICCNIFIFNNYIFSSQNRDVRHIWPLESVTVNHNHDLWTYISLRCKNGDVGYKSMYDFRNTRTFLNSKQTQE